MTPEQEQWAFAAKLMEIHGEKVGIYIMGRIEALRQNDDTGGVLDRDRRQGGAAGWAGRGGTDAVRP